MNKEIKRRISSLALATSLLLSGCGINNENTKESSKIELTTNENYYISKDGKHISLDTLNDSNYVSIFEDNKYTLYYKTAVYIKEENKIIDELSFDKSIIVTVLEMNNECAMIELPDGTIGYVKKDLLIKCPSLNKYNYEIVTDYKEKITTTLTYLYNGDGIYAGYVDANTKCNAVATNGEYTLITLENGISAFISSSTLINVNKRIDGYAIVNNNTIMYMDKELQIPYKYIDASSIVKVLYINDNYACIYDNSETRYINISDLNKDYIIVDLDEQQITCYLDYHLAGSWGTRTGKNTTPTHTGFFDIDAKAKDWEFTTFPGSYAKYWMPINGGEGIHDLVGDDEANYGNEAYKEHGSHGCIRVPAAASEFVYDNYDVGDMVLVRKK